jgi:SAM-dependent methyltransferase
MLSTFRKNIKKLLPQQYHFSIFKILTKLNHIKYIGNGVECPCCSSRLRDFAPFYQGSNLVDKICTKCLSLSRHRLIWLYLNDKGVFAKHLKVLHTAPEECFEKIFEKSKNIKYTTIDIDPNKANVSMDITSMDFADNSFDLIISVHVLEHILDDTKAMKEFHRVLMPGGFAILQVPIDYSRDKTYEDSSIVLFEDREKAFQQGDHVRIYGKDYVERLISSGFKVTVDDYVKTLDKNLMTKYCLDVNEMIYLCRK